MTQLCEEMKKQGSDKGDSWHNYTKFYSILFEDKKDEIKNVFELGIGTTNPAFESHMKPEFTPGGSLRGWRNYFPNAHVYGADIDKDILFGEERVDTFYVDQTDAESIGILWDDPNLKGDWGFDIMIDDGLHTLDAALTFFGESAFMLDDDGVYIVEDIQRSELQEYAGAFGALQEHMGIKCHFFDLPHYENKTDNIICVIHWADSTEYDEKIEKLIETING